MPPYDGSASTANSEPQPAWTARKRKVEGGRPELSTRDLLEAARGVTRHAGVKKRCGEYAKRGRPWTDTDTATQLELEYRTVGYEKVKRRKFSITPAWLSSRPIPRPDGHPGTVEFVPRRRMWGYRQFLADVVRAEREGWVGLRLSLEELAAKYGCSRRCAAGWRDEWEQLELLEVVSTWEKAERQDGREREQRRNVYRVGLRIRNELGPGLLEGVRDGESNASQKWRTVCAVQARRKDQEYVENRKEQAWAASGHKAHGTPSEPEGCGAAPAEPAGVTGVAEGAGDVPDPAPLIGVQQSRPTPLRRGVVLKTSPSGPMVENDSGASAPPARSATPVTPAGSAGAAPQPSGSDEVAGSESHGRAASADAEAYAVLEARRDALPRSFSAKAGGLLERWRASDENQLDLLEPPQLELDMSPHADCDGRGCERCCGSGLKRHAGFAEIDAVPPAPSWVEVPDEPGVGSDPDEPPEKRILNVSDPTKPGEK